MGFEALMAKWRVRIGHLFSLVLIAFAAPDVYSLAVGAVVSLFGESLRIYAAGHIRKNRELSVEGPYALCRNPLYLGSFLVMLGFCIASLNPGLTVAYFVLFWIVYGATIRSEERVLINLFGRAYADFCDATPRFFPMPGGLLRLGKGRFSIGQAWANKEHEGLIGVLAVHAAMAAMAVWRT